jgi:hypothetical protein
MYTDIQEEQSKERKKERNTGKEDLLNKIHLPLEFSSTFGHYFFFFFFITIVVLGVPCDTYQSSYNMS